MDSQKTVKHVINIILIIAALGTGYYVGFDHGWEGAMEKISYRDGAYLGFIRSIDSEKGNVMFDDAIWLSGTQGEDAAIAAGVCTEETRDECLPNDYFIENVLVKEESISLDSDIKIFMQTLYAENEGIVEREIGFEDFVVLINNPALHWNKLPYNVRIKDGKMLRIEEVYIP